jgi:hypothetical protein
MQMATMTDTTPASPAAPDGQTQPKECSTRELIDKVRTDVTDAQLQKEIYSQRASALEEHLKQLEEYDKKITSAVDDYGKGIGTVCTDLEDLRKAVEQGSTQAECLVPEDARKKIAQIYDDLRQRRDTLKSCAWDLSNSVLDKRLALEKGTAEIDREEMKLAEKLARLDRRKKEITDLEDLKQIVDCSDTYKKECRYAFYLDLKKRLEVDCPTADDYKCELVDEVKLLDQKRQSVQELDKAASTVQDQLDRVTKLRDDLVANWLDELCRAVTAGAVTPLPPDLATACGAGPGATKEPATPTPGANATTQQQEPQQGQQQPTGEHQAGGSAAPAADKPGSGDAPSTAS